MPPMMKSTARRGMGCAVCKKRKIKVRNRWSGWACPGPKDQTKVDVVFLYPRISTKPDSAGTSLRIQHGRRFSLGSSNRLITLSSPLSDRAMCFFLYHYVLGNTLWSDKNFPQGVLQYLPCLLRHEGPTGLLNTIICASGHAALSNSRASGPLKEEAYRLYGKSIRQLQTDLQDPKKVKSDATLAAILLMGTFEVIANTNLRAMGSYTNHIFAAGHCAIICHQLQEPMPHALEEWSRWSDPTGKNDESLLNRFTELNGRLAAARASIKRSKIRDPKEIARLLLPIDHMLEDWSLGLPDSWQIKSYRLLDGNTSSKTVYENEYHTYEGMWVASTWNNLRMIRITIHETVMIATRKCGLEMDQKSAQHSMRVLKRLANDICYSIPYVLGYRGIGSQSSPGSNTGDGKTSGLPAPGGYLLLWPLFHAGSSTAVASSQKSWIANMLRDIGSYMGIQLANSMASRVEDQEVSYAKNMCWLLGDFYPCE
ncbi:hypothetical protein M431DRAFT_502085 [Trichoderma harzianum CBS 226.95]|uniref:Zn(2)-C6 fungal-type domain-containing protein n=1 Tax=Trichoderma harzianum CBS 226.95 TaxID=983964 RepID=A0A2T3ZR81_TRIHA|nr:hypothetical protein M431DRAFT_502085 [Trichoderma harzianum CBS 226.95]PTB47308.1 hypothetical protein M431DRAFT_502085 [Trichoderma harzianum CBS 226.95]